MNGLSEFLVNSILGESKQPILIDMAKVKFFLGKGYSSVGRDNEDKKSSIPKGGEEDENLIALLDAMAVGNLDHKAFLDQYTRFDKYFGEEGDGREGGKPRLFKLLKHELELEDEIVNNIMTDYNYKDKDMEDEEYYEQYDDMAPDEEWKGPAGATKGVEFDDSEDDSDTIEDYITANSEYLQKQNIKESTVQSIALFGGGFKPPTKGHLDVVLKGLQQSPEVNKVKILVGQGERDGFTQAQSIKIWNLYRDINLIPVDTEIIAVKSPFEYYKKYLRDNPEDKVYVFIGSREGNEGDQLDVKQRSNFIKKYSDNVIPLEISSSGGISGTEARKLFKNDLNAFREMFPPNLNDHDWQSLLKILGKKQSLNEGRYDTISNQISSDIFTYWKDNITDRVITYEKTYQHEGEDIDVEATLRQTPEIEYLNVDGGADDETDFISISFEVNPYELPQALEDISFNLKDVVRHEIEHLTHGNSSHSKPGKYMENDEFIRQSINAGLLSKHRYFELEKEIDANLQGMYFRAKKEKRPFKDIINVYLNSQDITAEEKEGILNLWRKRNKALNLPLFENEETLNEVDLNKYVGKAKEGFKKFINALKQEGKESKDAFKLLAQSVKGEKTLSKEEKKEIGNQLKDIFKTIGYVGLFLLPGGSIFSILFNVLKLNKYVLPSAFQPESLTEASEDKILYAFDLDDTLITSNSKVIINHPDKETQQLTPAEYAIYEPQPGDEPDFREFTNLKDPKTIKDNFKLFSQILNKSSQLPGAKTIILTARQPEISTDVEAFLKKYNLPQVKLHAVNSSDPNEKLKVIEDYISQGFNKIRFYDDSPKNVAIIRSIDKPGVDVISKLVKHGPLSEGFLNEAIVGDKIECDKCDWSWNIVDGGDDLFICHKCGNDNTPLNEYDNVGPSTPKVYIVKDDGTYKEAPIELLSKISNLTYDMGGGETNYYPEKNIVIVDNIPVEEFAKEPGDIKGEKVYVEYNLNTPTILPKANKIIVSQLVYHLDNPKAFAQTISNSLKDEGTIEFFSDLMSKEDKIFLKYLSSEFGFGIPTTLSKYKNLIIKINKNKYKEIPESSIYKIIDDVGNVSKVSAIKKGSWWKYTKLDGNINFKPVEALDPEYFNLMSGISLSKASEKTLYLFSQITHHNIVDVKKIDEPLNEDINPDTYPFKITDKEYDSEDDSLLNINYQFSTPNNIYRVEFNSFEYSPEAKTFDLSFGVNTGDLNQIDTFQMTGEGNARKIFKTILDIVEDFISKEDVEKVVVDGTDEKRKRIYKTIFSSSPPNISSKIVLKENKINDPFGLIQFVNEVAKDSKFDYTKHIDSLNDYMVKNKMNVSPLPKLTLIDDDAENANDVMGKTAFYNPDKREIVLYTLLRHPKDILRSYAHEMIHHIQNLEDRLGNITGTDTREDDHLTDIEREAYTDGNLTFRKWTETINEISNQEMRYWAFHGDIFSELRKGGVEKYNEFKKLADGERLQAIEHFWDLLEKGKLSEGAKDLAPQEEVRIFNENCGCNEA